jgi:hypothetical protein
VILPSAAFSVQAGAVVRRGEIGLRVHDANLFDMEQKYADLIESEDIVAMLRQPAPAA